MGNKFEKNVFFYLIIITVDHELSQYVNNIYCYVYMLYHIRKTIGIYFVPTKEYSNYNHLQFKFVSIIYLKKLFLY